MRSSEVRLLLQDFCAQETQRKGDGLVVLSLPGEVGSLLVALAEPRLWSLKTVWPHRGRGLSWVARGVSDSAGMRLWLFRVPPQCSLHPALCLGVLKHLVIQQHTVWNMHHASDTMLALGIQGKQGRSPGTYSLAGRQT